MTDPEGKLVRKRGWNRRLITLGGTALAAGVGYAALKWPRSVNVRHVRAEPGTYNHGNMAEPLTLDPSQVQGESEFNVMYDLMTGLMAYDARSEPVPGMAERWTISSDGLTWTFHLREALWSDGTPVTAEDFVFAWRDLVDPKTAAPYAYFLFAVKNAEKIAGGKLPPQALGITAPDSKTLTITLEHPVPYLLQMLAHVTTYPKPRHAVAALGKAWIKPGNYVSNGPFLLTEWTPHSRVLLTKNPRFYDADKVMLEKVIHYPTDDYSAALQRLRAGELDAQDRIPASEIDWIKANMPETIDPIPQLTVEYVMVNHRRKPFDDIRVRTALNLATQRETICNRIRRLGDTPAYSIIPPGVANFPGGNSFDFQNLSVAQRVAKAQALMRAAGYGPDRRVKTTFMIRSTAAGNYRSVAAALQQMYSLIYIDIAILPNDFPIFMSVTQIHDFDICEPGWGADFNDAQTFLDLFRTGGGNNWGQYSNPAFDRLLAASEREPDAARRGILLKQAEALLLADQAAIPLFFFSNPSMARPYLKGWVPNVLDIHPARWMSIDEKARAATIVS